MVTDKQRNDWQALVDYLTPFGNGACINSLIEDGPDNTTDFKGLLEKFKRDDEAKLNHVSHIARVFRPVEAE